MIHLFQTHLTSFFNLHFGFLLPSLFGVEGRCTESIVGHAYVLPPTIFGTGRSKIARHSGRVNFWGHYLVQSHVSYQNSWIFTLHVELLFTGLTINKQASSQSLFPKKLVFFGSLS